MAAQPESGGLAAPEPSQRFNGALRRLGAPARDFAYRNAAGDVVMHVCRYHRAEVDDEDPDAPSADTSPYVTRWWLWEDHEWREHRGAPVSPLYRADRLWRNPAAAAYLMDSEEEADALQALFDESNPGAVATTWAGGLPGIKRADWTLLHERDVTVWPIANSLYQRALLSVAEELFPAAFEAGYQVHVVRCIGKPPGWGVSLAQEEGFTWNDIQEHMLTHLHTIGENLVTTIAVAPVREPAHEIKTLPGSVAQRWRDMKLHCATNGTPYANLNNVQKVISYHQGAYCDVWLDVFHNRIMTRETNGSASREWTEADTLEFTRYIQAQDGVNIPNMHPHVIHHAVLLHASMHKRNEVREWLDSLQWDGIDRLNDAMPLGWGTMQTDYYRAVGRCFIMGAAARILRPGCQVDNLPVFEGAEGIFKTTALIALASEQWFDSPTYALGHHDFYQALPGKWILEFAEMSNLAGRTGEQIRAVITRRSDSYRPSYGKITVTYPRMCVFSATTNETDWNKSPTGARRFWPVTCGMIDTDWIKANREQLFAEAVARVSRGEEWHDVPKDQAKKQQDARMPLDAWHATIFEFIQHTQEVTTEEIMRHALEITDRAKWSLQTKQRVSFSMRQLGWLEAMYDGRLIHSWRRGARKTDAPDPGDPSHGL